jgi:predicted RNase H-like nuclease (RuvC/YqgF family)
MTEVERLRQTLKAYELTIECLEIEIDRHKKDIKMLKSAVDGFSALTKEQGDRLARIKYCTEKQH